MRELRIEGSLASLWVPGSAATGLVWDALVAPLLLLPPRRRRRVLVLGLGGGSAARLARALAPRARIVGVELDRAVVAAARRRLDLDALGVEVVIGDALAFLERTRERFDAILEDLFVGRGRAERKPAGWPSPGLARAARRLAPGGLLCTNALDEAREVESCLCALFGRALRIEVAGYDNRIGVGRGAPLPARELRRRIDGEPLLARAAPRLRLRTVRDAAISSGRRPAPRPRRRRGPSRSATPAP
jgi:SAM-dependent methyltransferase